MNWYIIECLAIFPFKQNKQPGALLEFQPTGKIFFSLLSFTDVPERGCSTTAVHSQVVPAYHAEPSVNQA